ncbi:MAG: hypothetical protein NVSMB1_18360 [Polyangiales bacterium]
MQPRPSQLAQAAEVARLHPHAEKLAAIAADVAGRLADSRGRHAKESDIEEIAKQAGLDREQAETEFGNVFAILQRGAEDLAERAIVGAFVGAGVVRILEGNVIAARKWAERLSYLGAHTGFDPLSALPPGVSPSVLRPLYRALADHAREIDLGKLPTADRAQLLVCAAALADAVETMGSEDEIAQIVSRLAADLADPVAVRLITVRALDAPSTILQSGPSSTALKGHLSSPPRSALFTVFYALSGYMLLHAIALLVFKHLLGFKRDARLELTETGLEIKGKVALLGRELLVVNTVIPTSGLALIKRDVRYPSLPLYGGLASLLIGTYAGVSLLAWGVQAASPRLLGYGLLALLAGVVLDFVLTTLLPGAAGRCRLLMVPKQGRAVCVAGLAIGDTDRMLSELARRFV